MFLKIVTTVKITNLFHGDVVCPRWNWTQPIPWSLEVCTKPHIALFVEDNASEKFPFFQVIQQKTKRAERISMIGRLSDRMFTFSTISTHQTLEYFFIPFYPRNIFYILLNYSYSLFTDRNMDSSSWNAQRRKILARVRKAEDKKNDDPKVCPSETPD